MHKSILRASAAILFALLATSPLAQTWPSKSIHWIVPFPPGGSNDIPTRLIGERLSRAFRQPVVVENRAGAGGNIGTAFVAKSAPDGYTVLTTGSVSTAVPHLYSGLGFDPVKDFVAVTQLTRQPVVLAAHPSLGVRSVAELIALAKTKPGIPYATVGAGTSHHIIAEWFAKLAGIKLTHVPYKGGGQASTDLLGGQVKLASLGAAPLIAYYKSGKIRLLAQSTQKRAPSLPDVPTYEEAGFKGLVNEQWQGVFLPTGTPRHIVARLYVETVKALSAPELRERFAELALEPVGNTPEEFSKVVRSDYECYGRLVRELKITVD
jgi:tripartite-type tricarboxylate transporter receptor subunit TctC